MAPSLTALLLRGFGGDGWRDFGLAPRLGRNLFGYAVALAVFPVVTAVTLLGSALRLVTFPDASPAVITAVGQTFLIGAAPLFVKNLFEEAAWRGYLAPVMHRLGLNDYFEHLLVGFVWGAWHIPCYLYFLERQVLQEFTVMSVGMFIAVSFVVMIIWAIVFGELRLLTGSVWPAVVMHTVEDALLIQLFTDRRSPSQLAGTGWSHRFTAS